VRKDKSARIYFFLGVEMTSRRAFIGSSFLGFLGALVPGKSFGLVTAAKKTRVCKISSIPVSGGKIVKTTLGDLLVTQPRKNTFRAFSARCTHEGCTVGSGRVGANVVSGGVVTCNCHGAKFNANDGRAVSGPARSALKKYVVSKDKTYLYVS